MENETMTSDRVKKVLVVYYSKTGNTERVAKDAASSLGADLEIIEDKKSRKGIWAWFASGRDAMRKMKTEIGSPAKNPADYGLVVVGSPVWAGNITPAARTYLEQNRENIKNYAFFVTSGNTDSEKITPHVKEILGRDPLSHVGWNAAELKDENIYRGKLAGFLDAVKRKNV